MELEPTLDALIAEHGLGAVHRYVRGHPGICNNCGCPVGDQPHLGSGLGYCTEVSPDTYRDVMARRRGAR